MENGFYGNEFIEDESNIEGGSNLYDEELYFEMVATMAASESVELEVTNVEAKSNKIIAFIEKTKSSLINSLTKAVRKVKERKNQKEASHTSFFNFFNRGRSR